MYFSLISMSCWVYQIKDDSPSLSFAVNIQVSFLLRGHYVALISSRRNPALCSFIPSSLSMQDTSAIICPVCATPSISAFFFYVNPREISGRDDFGRDAKTTIGFQFESRSLKNYFFHLQWNWSENCLWENEFLSFSSFSFHIRFFQAKIRWSRNLDLSAPIFFGFY